MSSIELMTSLLGSKYQIVTQDGASLVLDKVPGASDLAISTPDALQNPDETESQFTRGEKTVNDYLFQLYLGSLTVVGLFVLFRMISKSR